MSDVLDLFWGSDELDAATTATPVTTTTPQQEGKPQHQLVSSARSEPIGTSLISNQTESSKKKLTASEEDGSRPSLQNGNSRNLKKGSLSELVTSSNVDNGIKTRNVPMKKINHTSQQQDGPKLLFSKDDISESEEESSESEEDEIIGNFVQKLSTEI
ncbi:hypothetical protein C9374_004156 [Naegleria lovaniensis]|uniref:Uncharacterized protein n=1 Tax=Naegleria lovaniensis TaxID=51637 RepID=A0AA88GN80_NAELO|nr:uncharacterized protein C9374_004156 [Naegleria lovaniensis]KAG2383485.1 hypothetical protein C9374_004156 [Naegleria lovaniensis]